MLHLNRRLIIERAAGLRLPAVYQWPETAAEGGLLGYGPSFIEVFRERARLVAKVLRGAKPADLPIEQPSTFKKTRPGSCACAPSGPASIVPAARLMNLRRRIFYPSGCRASYRAKYPN
jgi:hypothetical protein